MIGDKIREIREAKELGLNETAELAGMTGGYLSSIETNNKKNPSQDKLESIAKVLNVTVADFYKEESFEFTNLDKLKEDNKKLLSKIEKLTESKKQLIKNLISEFETK